MDKYENFDYAEVNRLLNLMEGCVERVKILCAKICTGFGEG